MNQTTISIRIDTNDKKGFENFCNSTGMNISTAINIFIKTVLREQKLPFEITTRSWEDTVSSKLLEAENEMDNNTNRYTKEEVLKIVEDIINKSV